MTRILTSIPLILLACFAILVLSLELATLAHWLAPHYFPHKDWFQHFLHASSWEVIFGASYYTTAFVSQVLTFGLLILITSIIMSYFLLPYLGLYGVFFTCVSGLGFVLLALASIFPAIVLKGVVTQINLFKWFTLSHSLVITFSLYVDNISYSFALLTTLIAFFVQVYAFAYFRYEPNVDRLLLFLNSFVASMLLLVLAGNLVVLFLGWELIGLTSFLLINFWATRVGTLKAAFKAFSFNKFSDFCIFLMLVFSVMLFSSVDIPTILTMYTQAEELRHATLVDLSLLNMFVIALMGAAFIKSAQIGGHVWLPDSMEAPVPASALIHSATLVSAGIFLILRFYPICQHSSFFNYVTPWLGLFTAWYGGAVAYFQNDLKRILAYSTISHCGFLMALASFGSVEHTLLYLYVHGFFKALAFLCVGNVLRFSHGYQDLRRMGQFWSYLPFELCALIFIMLNLSGLPFFFGFYIKHLVVSGAVIAPWSQVPEALGLTAATTGLFYSYKIIYYTFFDTKKGRKSTYSDTSRANLMSRYYSNSTLATLFSITGLLCSAYLVLIVFFYQKLALNTTALDNTAFILYETAPSVSSIDKANLFNAASINWVVLTLFSLLVLGRWDWSVNNTWVLTRGVFVISSCLLVGLCLNLYV